MPDPSIPAGSSVPPGPAILDAAYRRKSLLIHRIHPFYRIHACLRRYLSQLCPIISIVSKTSKPSSPIHVLFVYSLDKSRESERECVRRHREGQAPTPLTHPGAPVQQDSAPQCFLTPIFTPSNDSSLSLAAGLFRALGFERGLRKAAKTERPPKGLGAAAAVARFFPKAVVKAHIRRTPES